MKRFFLFLHMFICLLCCAREIKSVQDTIVIKNSELKSIGNRIFPLEDSDTMRELAYKMGVYCCLEVKNTLVIITDNACVCFNDSLTKGRTKYSLQCRYYKKHVKMYFDHFEDDAIVSYNDYDTLIFYRDWLSDVELGKENVHAYNYDYELSNGIINSKTFLIGNIHNGMQQNEIIKLLSLQKYIKKNYDNIFILSPTLVNDMWYLKNINYKIKEKQSKSLLLTFEKDILKNIEIKNEYNLGKYTLTLPSPSFRHAFPWEKDDCLE